MTNTVRAKFLGQKATGTGVDDKIKISSTDAVSGYAEEKFVAGNNVTFTKENVGENETYRFDVNAISGGGYAANIYFTTQDSDVSGYKKISYTNEATETILNGTISNQEVLFRTYIYDEIININYIDPGIWSANFRCKLNNTSGTTQLKFEAFVRHTDMTETTLFSQYSDDINNTDFETIIVSINKPAYIVEQTDRFGVRIYAKTTSNANITISTVVGDGNASYFTIPIAIRHNQLRGLSYEDSGHTGFLGVKSRTGLATTWSAEPTLYDTQATYKVYEYTYGTTKYYRRVYDTYDPATDTFYTTSALTTAICSRALTI